MAQYVYTGKAPEIPPSGVGIVRPRDVWEFAEPPTWGSWRELEPPEAEQADNSDGEGA